MEESRIVMKKSSMEWILQEQLEPAQARVAGFAWGKAMECFELPGEMKLILLSEPGGDDLETKGRV